MATYLIITATVLEVARNPKRRIVVTHEASRITVDVTETTKITHGDIQVGFRELAPGMVVYVSGEETTSRAMVADSIKVMKRAATSI